MAVTRDWSREEVTAIHRHFMNGATLRELGQEYGATHEAIRQLFQQFDLSTDRPMPQTIRSYTGVISAWRREEEIIEAYKELGTIDAVAERTSLPRHAVADVLDSMTLRQLYRRRGETASRIEESDVIDALQKAAELCGEPLTIPAYRSIAPEQGFPSDLTVTRMFGNSWGEACKAAGVKANPSKGKRGITKDECIASIRECARELDRISYEIYSKWAKENGKPSGPTVRVKVGPWSEALRLAVDVKP